MGQQKLTYPCLRSIFLLLCLGGHFQVSYCHDIFRSIARLRLLVTVEHELMAAIRNYITESRILLRTGGALPCHPNITGTSINALERRLLHREETVRNMTGGIEVRVSHPIQAFQLIIRFIKDWKPLKCQVDSVIGHDIISLLDQNIGILPNVSDFIGTGRAIMRLQSTYNINARDFADGNIPGATHTHGILTVADCYYIGEVAYSNGDNHYCVVWMLEALRRYREGFPMKSWEHPTEALLLEFLAYCYDRAGFHHSALKYMVELLTLDPNNKNGLTNHPKFVENVKNGNITSDEEPLYPMIRFSPEEVTYHKTCRDEMNGAHSNKMTCRYLSHNPLLRLYGISEEVINTKPRIVMFHNLLSERETDVFKQLTFSELETSNILHATDVQEAQNRVSNTAWLNDTYVPWITKRIEMVTGLNAESSEPFQVLNYGIGGHYAPHLDVGNSSTVRERIATLLIYLSDIEYGGGTAFLEHGVRTNSRKGDAVFWYNLHKSGEVDMSSVHGGCPVLLGEKWITNKWFNYYAQFDKMKCGLSPED